MVRESTSKPGCYALSLRVPREFQPSGIAHYLIMRTNKGYKIKVSFFSIRTFCRIENQNSFKRTFKGKQILLQESCANLQESR